MIRIPSGRSLSTTKQSSPLQSRASSGREVFIRCGGAHLRYLHQIARFLETTQPAQSPRHLLLGKEIGNKEEIGEGMRMLGFYHRDDNEYDKAYESFKESEKIAIEINNKKLLGMTYNAFGVTKRREGKLDEALDYFNQFLEIGESQLIKI